MFVRPLTIGALSLANNLLFAPLTGISTVPMRLIAREFGAGLVYSEMVRAAGVVHGAVRNTHHMDLHPAEHPVGVQLADADVGALVEAAHIAVSRGADLIDLNCGCPVKKVVKTECGAALLKDPPLIARIVAGLRGAVPAHIPVTLKVRTGWSAESLNAPLVARMAENNGAAAVTVHGRTREQLYNGQVDLSTIRAVKEAVGIPVIGNGDIVTAADAARMFDETGCDGVMIGRGAVGNPWIFGQIAALSRGEEPSLPGPAEMKPLLLRVLDLLVEVHGTYKGVRMLRKFIGYWLHGVSGGRHFRATVMTFDDAVELRRYIDENFGALGTLRERLPVTDNPVVDALG